MSRAQPTSSKRRSSGRGSQAFTSWSTLATRALAAAGSFASTAPSWTAAVPARPDNRSVTVTENLFIPMSGTDLSAQDHVSENNSLYPSVHRKTRRSLGAAELRQNSSAKIRGARMGNQQKSLDSQRF